VRGKIILTWISDKLGLSVCSVVKLGLSVCSVVLNDAVRSVDE
jgi:hypothetical protein